MLVAAAADALEPLGEARVQPGTAAEGQRGVGDLAREGVLEAELALPGDRRSRPPADEVALLEQIQIDVGLVEERAHRALPERAAGHRRRLQRMPLLLGKKVYAGRDDRLDGVGGGQRLCQLARYPAILATTAQDAAVQQ